MTDSGSPQPPSGPRAGPSIFPPGKEEGQGARIERATGALQIIRKPTRIIGEVTGENRDGSIRIHTDQGDLDVRIRLRDGQQPPAEGARVEIDIAPGRPPRQAIVRPAPPDIPETPPRPQQPQPEARPVARQTQQETEQAPEIRVDEKPAEIAIPSPVPSTAFPPADFPPPPDVTAIQKPLQVSDAVRLLPLPPGSVVIRSAPEIIETAVSAVTAPLVLKATLIAQNARSGAGEPMIRIASPAPTVAETPAAPPIPETATAPETPATPAIPETTASTETAEIPQEQSPEAKAETPAVFIVPLPSQPVQAPPPEQIPQQRKPLPPAAVTAIVLSPAAHFEGPASTAKQIVQEAPLPTTDTPSLPVLILHAELPRTLPDPGQASRNAAQNNPVFIPKVRFLPLAPPAPAENQIMATGQKNPAIFFVLPPPRMLHHMPLKITAPAPVFQNDAPQTAAATISTKPIDASTPPAVPKIKTLDIIIAAVTPPAVKIITAAVGVPAGAQKKTENAPAATANTLNPFMDFSMPAGKEAAAIPTKIPPKILTLTEKPNAPAPETVHQTPEKIILQETPVAAAATVIGRTAQNLPVLSVTLPGSEFPQNFVLQLNAANLPEGSVVSFIPHAGIWHAMLPAATPPVAEMAALPPATPWELFGSFSWPVMEDIQKTLLQQPDGMQGVAAIARMAPNPANPASLPAAALLFLAAVRSGDITTWLGDKTIDILRRAGRADIIARAGRDFAGLQRSATEPVSQDWRGVTLPLAWQNDIHKMMLYFRRDNKDGENGDTGIPGTRFIFDLNLSRMGAVQIDGYHRPAQKKLDLIVRTQKPLGQDMQQAMRRRWAAALEQTRLQGEMSFQSKPEQFVKMALPSGKPGGVVV